MTRRAYDGGAGIHEDAVLGHVSIQPSARVIRRQAHAHDHVARIHITPIGVAACLAAAFTAVKVQLPIGEVFIAELLVPVVAFAALFNRNGARILRLPLFWILILSLAVSLAGYMVADIVREAPMARYLRGWGRLGMLGLAIVAVGILIGADRRHLWWLALGIGMGGLVYVIGVEQLPISAWKLGYAGFATILWASACALVPRTLGALGFIVLAVASFILDSRIHGVVCLALAGMLWSGARPAYRAAARKLSLAAPVVVLIAIGAIHLGLIGSVPDDTAERRGQSDLGRWTGVLFALRAIGDSPLIGYGSWGAGPELEQIEREVWADAAPADTPLDFTGSTLLAHSQILQSWLEGGVLGTAFFLVLLVLIPVAVYRLIRDRSRDALFPLLAYFLLYGGWHLLQSPFAGDQRISIALTVGALLTLALERRRRWSAASAASRYAVA